MPTHPSTPRSEALELEIAALKQALWVARDEAIGAVAEKGVLAGRVADLEVRIATLREAEAEFERLVPVFASMRSSRAWVQAGRVRRRVRRVRDSL